jgi:hypothetical protein
VSDAPPSRSPRAAVFAAVCVGVSAGGHVLTSGHEVPLTVLAVGYLLVFAIARVAAGAEHGLAAVCGWMVWGQFALHLLYGVASPDAGAATGGTGHLLGHPAMPAALSDDGGSGVPMLVAHLAAALLSAWWVRQGEAAAFALARQVRTLLRGVFTVAAPRPLPVTPSDPVRRPDTAVRPAGRLVLRHAVVRRGPPASS